MSQVKVTSAEVAALAGVSQSAVSRVFTPGASASAKTALKVRQAAVKLGYRPNSIARAMVSGKSRIIGLVAASTHIHLPHGATPPYIQHTWNSVKPPLSIPKANSRQLQSLELI